MDTLFYVLDKNYQRIGIIDTFTSLMWCKRYYEIGGLDLQIEATEEKLALLEMGNYIVREDDDCVFRIESREIETKDNGENFIIIGGVDCKAILSQRIIEKTVSCRGLVRDYISQMIIENVISPVLTARRIPNFQIVDNELITDVIIQQTTYNIISDKITELCRAFLLGWRVYLEDGIFKFTLYKGEDKSHRVEFSIDNDNLISTKTIDDSTEFKNSALIAGEGEGEARATVWIGGEYGLDRYETFIDESSSSDGMEQIQYLNQLKSKGFEELAKNHRVLTFEGEIDASNSRYKIDYDLGDVIKIKNELGLESNARITEVIETWDGDGYTVEPKLEYLEFQSPAPQVELEKELLHDLTELSEPLVFLAEDHPFGITIELAGGAGQDGKAGSMVGSSSGSMVANYYAGTGGAGGAGGNDCEASFVADGVEYYSRAVGGFGGGGGGGGYAGYGYPAMDYPAGKGGKGGSAGLVAINLTFNDKVEFNFLSKSPQLASGEAGGGKTLIGTASAGYSDAGNFPAGGKSGDGNSGATYAQAGGDGGNAGQIWDRSTCSYDDYTLSEYKGEAYCRIYTWKNINAIEVEAVRKLASVSSRPALLTSEKNEKLLTKNTLTYTQPISDTIRISELPEAETIGMGDVFPIVQNGETVTTSLQAVTQAIGLVLPAGLTLPYVGEVPPIGYLLCDGSEYNSADYPALSELLLPLPFNDEVPEGRFRVPDMRARFPQGADGNLGQTIEAGLPNITGETLRNQVDYGSWNTAKGAFMAGGYRKGNTDGGDGNDQCRTSVFDASRGETKTDGTLKTDADYKVYGNSDTVQPPAVALNYIIKT